MTTPALAPVGDPSSTLPRPTVTDDAAFAGVLAGATAAPRRAIAPDSEPVPLPDDDAPEQVLPDSTAVLAAQAQLLVLPLPAPVVPVTGSPGAPGVDDVVRAAAAAAAPAAPAVLGAADPTASASTPVAADPATTATPVGAPPAAPQPTVPAAADTPSATADAPTPGERPLGADRSLDADRASGPDPAAPGPAVPTTDPGPRLDAPAADAPAPASPVAPPSAVASAVSVAPTAPNSPLVQVATERAPRQVQPAVAELARGLRDVGGGRASLVVRLDPPELGPVVVRLTVRDGRVDVQLRTSEAVASVGLAQAAPQVRSTLAEHGLDLSTFDVAQGDTSAAPSERRASSDQATPERRPRTDVPASAAGARGTDALLDTTPDQPGSPAGAWL